MSSVKGDIGIGVRAFELINARGGVTQEMHRLGMHRNKAYEWAAGKVPSGRALQAMCLAGYDIVYILTGRKGERPMCDCTKCTEEYDSPTECGCGRCTGK